MRSLRSDHATQHRIAAVFALAFGTAAVTCMSAVLALSMNGARTRPAFALERIPDASWGHWLPGALSASSQQDAAAAQWLHVIVLFGGVALLIAAVNALIALLSHANERRYETALRALVGAAPRKLEQQQLGDALVNAMLGCATGAPIGVVAALLVRNTWVGSKGPSTYITWAVCAAVLCTLLALTAARGSTRRLRRRGWMSDALAPEARHTPGWGAAELRAMLTVVQLTCAIALTTVGGLVWSYTTAPRVITALAATDQYVARVTLPANQSVTRLLAEARVTSGVESESIASAGALVGVGKVDKVLSFCGQCSRGAMYTPMFAVETQQHVVGPAFFDITHTRILHGREFSSSKDDALGVVINHTFARLAFDDPNPIGKRIHVGGWTGAWYHVIGVVEDLPTVGLQYLSPEPSIAYNATSKPAAIYFSALAHPPTTFDLIVRSKQRHVALAGLSFEPIKQVFARAQAPQSWFARVLIIIGLLICGAASVGAFVNMTLNVRAQRIEIAVRRAVGATRRDILMLVYGTVGSVLLKALVVGTVVGIVLSRVAATFVPGLVAFNWRVSVTVSVAFTLVALAAAFGPTRTALRIPPGAAE